MNYKELPKIDLHCHFDGSVRAETIIELAKQDNIELASYDLDEVRNLLIAPDDCKSLDEYLLRFDLPNKVMQTSENIERVMYELYEDAALENVKYMEVRFGPLLHTVKGLSVDEILKSVVKGMKRAENDYDIHGNIILSFLRVMPTDRIVEVLNAGLKYLNKGICAVDLAASEVAGFSKVFKPFIDIAYDLGYRVTIHAGETGIGQNVTDAILDLHAERIGHGIYINSDEKAYDLVKDKDIVLEICPTSNVQTKAVPSISKHPINEFYKDGLKITINTDNRTVSNTTMTKECKKTIEEFALTIKDYREILSNSIEASFAKEEIKMKLRENLNSL